MEQAIAALRAVGEATRLRIVTVLRRGELTVSELVQVLGQSQPRVSRHLRLLAEAARVARPGGAVVIVDFAAHDLEALRDHHAHRRLGFADEEVAGWAAQAGLAPEPPRALAPKSEGLTVKVWRARRP